MFRFLLCNRKWAAFISHSFWEWLSSPFHLKNTKNTKKKQKTTRCCVLAVGTEGFRHLCLACVRGLEEEDEDVYLSPLELLETLCGVFPEQARGQVAHLGMVFQAAQVNKIGVWGCRLYVYRPLDCKFKQNFAPHEQIVAAWKRDCVWFASPTIVVELRHDTPLLSFVPHLLWSSRLCPSICLGTQIDLVVFRSSMRK